MLRNARQNSPLIGIDEAGRGPLAGPVAVGAFAVRSRIILKKFRGVKDSKQLSEKQRDEWFKQIRIHAREGNVMYAVSFSGAAVIDSEGLSHAVYSAVNRSLRKIERKCDRAQTSAFISAPILLDGLLHASSRYPNQKTIIGGDFKEKIIALASICAKVLRDRKMKRFAKSHPLYGFEIHKGYGTAGHFRAIKEHGISPIHRISFLKSVRYRVK